MQVTPDQRLEAPDASVSGLVDLFRDRIRARHYAVSTEENYIRWIRRFLAFHGQRHPAELGEKEINDFLSHLAVEGRVAASTQNQALCAIVFEAKGTPGGLDEGRSQTASGESGRHHTDGTALERAIKEALRKAGIAKPASAHSLRHSFATH